jgi:UDP:flavonoid glycosyltransferase YjiC (YdhE family)
MYLVWWVKPFNRVRKSLGLRTKNNFFDQMAGELILMPDFAAFKGMEITDTALPIGPLAWEPKDEEVLAHVDRETVVRFQAFLDSAPERPLVYLTMGSTGTLDLFRTVIAALKDKPYRLAITTGGQFDIPSLGELPSSVFAIPFYTGNRILEKAAVTINHGGSGSAYQAMAAQVPQIMIPTHPDQQWNADIVQGEGAGIRLRHRGLTEGKIAEAVEALLKRQG